MSTEHFKGDDIVSSGAGGGTMRADGPVIPSGVSSGTMRTDGPVVSAGAPVDQSSPAGMPNDIVLNSQPYAIIKLIAQSGESQVYLATHAGQRCALKYYYSQYRPKEEVMRQLKGLRHPDVLALIDYGYHKDRFFEVLEYAEGGTLQDCMPVTSLPMIREIVQEVVSALEYCHTKGIIHRDIKPANIFYRTPGKKDIVVGDFGIASNVAQGEDLVKTTRARTTLYAAPELFVGKKGHVTIDKSVDYYALGMTLLHIWSGEDPLDSTDEFATMDAKRNGRFPFPPDMDNSVRSLVHGLLAVNPADRWGFGQVQQWLRGNEVSLRQQAGPSDYKQYSFGVVDGVQVLVDNPKDLADQLELHPDKGEGQLYRNTIAKWLEPVDQGLANELMDIVERDYPRDRSAGVAKAIYLLDRERPFKDRDGVMLDSQNAMATHFEENFAHYQQELSNPNAAFYVFLEARDYKDKADEYRAFFKQPSAEAALNTLILALQGAEKCILGDHVLHQPCELLALPATAQRLAVQDLANTNSKLSIWLAGFKDLQPTITQWRIMKLYTPATLRHALGRGLLVDHREVNTQEELYSLLRDRPALFFSASPEAEQQRAAGEHWVKNYCNSPATSFTRIVVAVMRRETIPEEESRLMFRYALAIESDSERDIYAVIESLLPAIERVATSQPAVLNDVVDKAAMQIQHVWKDQKPQAQSSFLTTCLRTFAVFAEEHMNECPAFFKALTLKLDDSISDGIRQDIKIIQDKAPRA